MDHLNISFEGEGESMSVIVSGDATLFPRMLVFLEFLGFERLEHGGNRYFISLMMLCVLHTTQNHITYVLYHSSS